MAVRAPVLLLHACGLASARTMVSIVEIVVTSPLAWPIRPVIGMQAGVTRYALNIMEMGPLVRVSLAANGLASAILPRLARCPTMQPPAMPMLRARGRPGHSALRQVSLQCNRPCKIIQSVSKKRRSQLALLWLSLPLRQPLIRLPLQLPLPLQAAAPPVILLMWVSGLVW